MPTYITLYNWTQKGIENVKESPARLDAAKQAVEAMGGKIVGFYLVQGQYDMVAVSEAPNDETAAKMVLSIGSQGSVRSVTMRAYKEDEYRKIISELP
jgi:uncharacterized protein with GYD domain